MEVDSEEGLCSRFYVYEKTGFRILENRISGKKTASILVIQSVYMVIFSRLCWDLSANAQVFDVVYKKDSMASIITDGGRDACYCHLSE